MARKSPGLRRVAFPARTALLAAVIIFCVFASFIAGRFFTPQEDNLAGAAQAKIPVVATVQEREIDTFLSFTGSVKEGKSAEIAPAVLPETPVVANVSVAGGDTIRAGTLLGTIANIPVFALPEELPLFRDIAVGDRGDDVKALQRGLVGLGYVMDVDGNTGAVTMDAVRKLFQQSGFTLPVREKSIDAALHGTPIGQDDGTDSEHGPVQPTTEPCIPAQSFASIPRAAVQVLKTAKTADILSMENSLLSVRYEQGTVEFRADPVAVDALAAGQEVIIDVGTVQMQGTIENIGEFSMGEETGNPGRNVSVIFDAPEFDGLAPGQLVTVRTISEPDRGMSVPVASLREDAEGSYVFKRTGSRDPDLAVERAAVEVISNSNGWAIVESDALQLGDEVEL